MILDFVNRSDIAAAYPAYRQGDWMLRVIEAVTVHLANSCEGQDDWSSAIAETGAMLLNGQERTSTQVRP